MSTRVGWTVAVFEQREVGAPIRALHLEAETEAQALERGRGAARLFGGAVALRRTMDEEGRVWTTEPTARFGDLPEGWVTALADEVFGPQRTP